MLKRFFLVSVGAMWGVIGEVGVGRGFLFQSGVTVHLSRTCQGPVKDLSK